MDTEDSFKILRLRFLRPPPAFVTLPSESGSRGGWKVPITLAVGVTDDYGVHQDTFDSLDLHLLLLDPLTSLPLPHLTLTLSDSSPPSSSFTLTPSTGPYTTLRLTLSIPPNTTLPPSFRILLAVTPPSTPPPRLGEVSQRMKELIGEGGQGMTESWDGERFVFMRGLSGEVEVRRSGKKGREASASNEKVQIIYRTINLPSSSPSPFSEHSPSLPPLAIVERPGLNNSTGQRLWDCAIGMSCWLSLHPEILSPSATNEEEHAEPPAKRPRPTPSKEKVGEHLLLELGAGSALASLSSATLLHHSPSSPSPSSTRLLATDVEETVETTLIENLTYNTLPRLPIETSILPWGVLSPSQLNSLLAESPERLTVLGADILYNPSSHSLLLSTLLSLLREGKEGKEDRAFIAYKKRTEGDDGFFEMAGEEGLEVESVWKWGEVGVWRFERGRE